MFARSVGLLAAVLAVALLAMAGPAAAHERSLTLEVEDHNRVEIASETAVPEGEVDFRFRAIAEGRPKLAVQVEQELENGTAEVETEVEFSATFREVFEFADTNGNGVLDSDETRLSTIRLGTLAYEPIEVASHSQGGLEGFRVTLRGTQDGFSFALVSYLFPDNAVVNGTPVPEEAVKVDILIEGYPFTVETSLLGLEIGVESTVEQEMEVETDDEGGGQVTVSVERGTAFFEWSPEATVDGEVASVGAQWRPELDRLFLYYPHGNAIVHDPLLGFRVGASSSLLNATTVGLLAGVGAVGFVLVLLAWRRRS